MVVGSEVAVLVAQDIVALYHDIDRVVRPEARKEEDEAPARLDDDEARLLWETEDEVITQEVHQEQKRIPEGKK